MHRETTAPPNDRTAAADETGNFSGVGYELLAIAGSSPSLFPAVVFRAMTAERPMRAATWLVAPVAAIA